MARPFRFRPPAMTEAMLARTRLVDRLAVRWHRRVVTVVAGPGFGKTVLLAAAMEDGSRPEGAIDVWLSCEPGDNDGFRLLGALGEALGIGATADFDAVMSAVWVRAPQPVCFVLDDLHEIASESDGLGVVVRLVDELPLNGHLVLASRERVPIPMARLAASGGLERIHESDLLFDADELAMFAASRGVPVDVLRSSGGWPAIAALGASTGADLLFDYLWEEVLERLGDERARDLARLVAAGGGDDRVVRSLVPHVAGVDDLVAGLPLVERSATGWVVLHPLWGPALRRLLTDDEADDARRSAAAVHKEQGRYDLAVDLFGESEAWHDVLETVRAAALEPGLRVDASVFGRWHRSLPVEHRRHPVALLAGALDLQMRSPLDALPLFDDAATGFRDAGDVEAEIVVIHHAGLVRWWANDLDGLLVAYQRSVELAAAGHDGAAVMAAIGDASISHLGGDSEATLAALAGVDDARSGGWTTEVHWLRHVAHRRLGDVDRAGHELALAEGLDPGESQTQLDIARLRLQWLTGEVDAAMALLPSVEAQYRTATNRYLHAEAALELAAKSAWLGDTSLARSLLERTDAVRADTPGALAQVLRLIAQAAVAVEEGDEETAASILAADETTTPGRPDNWYWFDRSALALLHVLVPGCRPHWDARPLAPIHQVGLTLGRALEAARAGDLAVVRKLAWPDAGTVRANLPRRWVAELMAAGAATGNPAPEEIAPALGTALGILLRDIAGRTGSSVISGAAERLAAQIPVLPPFRLRVDVLGPLEVRRDDQVVEHPDLLRRRVQELLAYLVVHRRTRRDAVADALWPEHLDPRHNLRVTLNYLQRVLEPERGRGEPAFFVRSQGELLELASDEHLHVDAWELDSHLQAAEHAERARDPDVAIAAYAAALPLWRGEPFLGLDADWAETERSRWRARFTDAALRHGELSLANDAPVEARRAAERALAADATSEAAFQLAIRAGLACGDRAGARLAVDRCLRALDELDVGPDPTTRALIDAVEGR